MKKLISYWPAVLIGIVPFIGLGIEATSVTNISIIIGNVVTVFVGIFWAIAVAFALWTAISYMTAGGDETKIKKAKTRLIYTIIAFVIALSINLVKSLIVDTIGGSKPLQTW